MASMAQATSSGAFSRPAPVDAGDKASLTTWIAVIAGMIGAFMSILNIQITNASLLDIEGGIGDRRRQRRVDLDFVPDR